MGLRVKRYGPLSTMAVVGRLVGTFEPPLVMVTMAQARSASARTNTIAPSQPAARPAGRNGKGTRRRPNNDLRGICRVMHGGTSLGTQGPCLCHLADPRQYGGSIKVARGSAAARARTQESNGRSR